MKVLFATGIFPPDIGGPANFVPMMAEAWRASGQDPVVVTYSDAPEDDAVRPYRVIRVTRAGSAPRRLFRYLKALWREAEGARVIFAQDAVSSGLPAWIVACLRRKRFVIKVVGDYAWERAKVRASYGLTLDEFQKDRAVPFNLKLLRALQGFVARRADLVMTPSRYLGGIVKGWGVDEKRVRVVYNGIEPLPAPEAARVPHRVVTAARLVPWKGIDTLIAAMPKVLEKVSDAELVVIGDGPDEEKLKRRVEALKLGGKVRFLGRLSKADLARQLAEAGVFALVSSYEGFSHQLVEVMRAGAPVVASRAGGNVELVRDGENGLLVEYGDIEKTADALERLMGDRGLAERLAARAKEDAAVFTVERQIRETTETVLGNGGLRVVIVSRDGTAADPASRTAGRMRAYAAQVAQLRVVALAREDARAAVLGDNLAVDIIDVRKPFTALFRACKAVSEAARAIDADLVIAQDPFEAALSAWWTCWKDRRALLIEEHGGVFLGEYWKGESSKNRFLHPIGLCLLKRADGIRAVSKKIKDDLHRRFPKKRVESIPVYTEPISCARKVDVAFGYVGRLVAQKNLPGLLRAFHTVHRAHPDARLLIVGSGPLEGEVKRLAAEYGMGEAVGWMPHVDDVASVYGRIGALVLPSWYEGWGRVVVEAMQCGAPVIMSDVGCAGEIVRDDAEGKIVPVGDDEKLAAAMIALLDPWTRDRMSAAASVRARSMPKPEELTTRLVAFWKEVAGV